MIAVAVWKRSGGLKGSWRRKRTTCQAWATLITQRHRAQVSPALKGCDCWVCVYIWIWCYYGNCHISGVIERWELIQAQSADSDHKEREDLVLWQKMTSDLDAMEAWLGQAKAELEELRGQNLSADIHTIEQRIRKLKVCVAYLVHSNIFVHVNLCLCVFAEWFSKCFSFNAVDGLHNWP